MAIDIHITEAEIFSRLGADISRFKKIEPLEELVDKEGYYQFELQIPDEEVFQRPTYDHSNSIANWIRSSGHPEFDLGAQSALLLAIENANYRNTPRQKPIVRYFLCPKGFLVVVSDKGSGFNVRETYERLTPDYLNTVNFGHQGWKAYLEFKGIVGFKSDSKGTDAYIFQLKDNGSRVNF